MRSNAKIGAQATRDAAVAAGIPESTLGLGTEISNVWAMPPRVLDVANAYASFAAEEGPSRDVLSRQTGDSPAIGVDFTAQLTSSTRSART
ncbi:MAG: hypothetical protein IPM08_15170 [Actinomycetales bacterium]|nr:hypothetical protein [Actinomycetales bacterium]